jgi:nitrate reductase alpha subunit
MCKGIAWNTSHEVDLIGLNNGINIDNGLPNIKTGIDACEVILFLAPETNGEVALKSWQSLGNCTGLDHTHLALDRAAEKIRLDVQVSLEKSPPGPVVLNLNMSL